MDEDLELAIALSKSLMQQQSEGESPPPPKTTTTQHQQQPPQPTTEPAKAEKSAEEAANDRATETDAAAAVFARLRARLTADGAFPARATAAEDAALLHALSEALFGAAGGDGSALCGPATAAFAARTAQVAAAAAAHAELGWAPPAVVDAVGRLCDAALRHALWTLDLPLATAAGTARDARTAAAATLQALCLAERVPMPDALEDLRRALAAAAVPDAASFAALTGRSAAAAAFRAMSSAQQQQRQSIARLAEKIGAAEVAGPAAAAAASDADSEDAEVFDNVQRRCALRFERDLQGPSRVVGACTKLISAASAALRIATKPAKQSDGATTATSAATATTTATAATAPAEAEETKEKGKKRRRSKSSGSQRGRPQVVAKDKGKKRRHVEDEPKQEAAAQSVASTAAVEELRWAVDLTRGLIDFLQSLLDFLEHPVPAECAALAAALVDAHAAEIESGIALSKPIVPASVLADTLLLLEKGREDWLIANANAGVALSVFSVAKKSATDHSLLLPMQSPPFLMLGLDAARRAIEVGNLRPDPPKHNLLPIVFNIHETRLDLSSPRNFSELYTQMFTPQTPESAGILDAIFVLMSGAFATLATSDATAAATASSSAEDEMSITPLLADVTPSSAPPPLPPPPPPPPPPPEALATPGWKPTGPAISKRSQAPEDDELIGSLFAETPSKPAAPSAPTTTAAPQTPSKATEPAKLRTRLEEALEHFIRKALSFLAGTVFSSSALDAAPLEPFIKASFTRAHADVIISLCHNLSPLVPVTISGAQARLGPAIPRFQPCVRALRSFVAAFASSPALGLAMQDYIIERASTEYLLSSPLEIVNLTTRLWLRRATTSDAGQSALAKNVWTLFAHRLAEFLAMPASEEAPHELVSYERMLEMLLVYSTLLSQETRRQLLHTLLGIAIDAAEKKPAPSSSWSARLILARVLLLAQYMAENSDGGLPEQLVGQVERNILDRSLAPTALAEAMPKQYSAIYGDEAFVAAFAAGAPASGALGRIFPYALPSIGTGRFCSVATLLPSNYGQFHTRLLGLLKLDWRVGGHPYISDYAFRATWSLLQALPPPQEFLDSIKSPSLLVAQEPSDVVLYILSWLARIAFADVSLPNELVCPPPESVPIASHFRACMLLLSGIAGEQPKATSGPAYHTDAVVRAILLMIYSLLPAPSSRSPSRSPASTPPPAAASSAQAHAAAAPKKSRSRREAMEAYHDSIRRYLLTHSSDAMPAFVSHDADSQPAPPPPPAPATSTGRFNAIGAGSSEPPPPPPPPSSSQLATSSDGSMPAGPSPTPMERLPESPFSVAMASFLASSTADIVRVVSGLVAAYASYTREWQLLPTLFKSAPVHQSDSTMAVITELVKSSLPPTALASLEKLGLPAGVSTTCAKWGEAKYSAPQQSAEGSAKSAFRMLESQVLLRNASVVGDNLGAASVASVQVVIASSVQLCLELLASTINASDTKSPASAEIAQAMAPAFFADEFGFVRRSVCTAIERVLGPIGVRNHVLPVHMHHIERFLGACARVFAETHSTQLVADHPLEAATLGALSYVSSSMRPPMSKLFVSFYIDGTGLATLLRLLLSCRVSRAIEALASELCIAITADRSDGLGTRFRDKISALFEDENAIPDAAIDEFLAATLVSSTAPAGVLNSVADFLMSIVREPSRFGQRLAVALLRLLPAACAPTISAPLPQYLSLLEFACATQGRLVEMTRAVLSAMDAAGVPEKSAVVATLPVLVERLLFAITPEKRGHRMPSLIPADSKAVAADKSTAAAVAQAAKKLPWWTELQPIDRTALCSYTKTGRNYEMQPWYYCYTCGLTFSEGCCILCARVCHEGHELSFARTSNFFCDCGAGAKRVRCKCLRPRPAVPATPTSASAAASSSSSSAAADGSAPSLRRSMLLDSTIGHTPYDTLSTEQRAAVREELCSARDSTLGNTLLANALRLLPVMSAQHARNSPPSEDSLRASIFTRAPKPISSGSGTLRPKRSTKTDSISVKTRKDRASNPELRRRLESGAPRRLLVSQPGGNGSGVVVAGEGDKLCFLSQEALLQEGSGGSDKPFEAKKVSRFAVGFDVVGMRFHSDWPTLLAVYGLRECRVITLADGGKSEVVAQLSVGQLPEGCFVVDVAWIPDSSTGAPIFVLATDRFVQIFDLSRDAVSPIAHLVPPDAADGDAVTGVAVDPTSGALCVSLSSCRVSAVRFSEVPPGVGAIPLLPGPRLPFASGDGSSLVSISASASLRALVVGFSNGTTFCGRPSLLNGGGVAAATIADAFQLSGGGPSSACCGWTEVSAPGHVGVFVATSLNSTAAFGVRAFPDKIAMQELPRSQGVSKDAHIEGIAVVSARSTHPVVILLTEDGALSRFSVHASASASSEPSSEKAKDKGKPPSKPQKEGISGSGAEDGDEEKKKQPKIPFDFFEHVVRITPEITVSGELLQLYTQDAIKQRLASNEEYLVSPRVDGLDVTVINHDRSRVIVGVRLLLGNASTQHITREIRVHGRSIPVKEGARRWYDVPFTLEEAIMHSEREVTVSLGPSFVASNKPVLDSFEVYALRKDAFGFREWPSAAAAATAAAAADESWPAFKATRHTLLALSLFLRAGGKDVAVFASECARTLPKMLTDDGIARSAPVARPLKAIVRQLCVDDDEYRWAVDSVVLNNITATVSLSKPSVVDVEHCATALKKIAERRPANMARFCKKTSQLVPAMLARKIVALVLSRTAFSDLQATVGNAVRATIALADADVSLRAPAFDVVKELLTAKHQPTRCAASTSVCSLLSTLSHAKDPRIAAPPKQPSSSAAGGLVYKCDACGMFPIVGARWACGVCPNFDLCESCHSAGAHDPSHSMTRHECSSDFAATLVPPGVDPNDDDTLLRLAIELSTQQQKEAQAAPMEVDAPSKPPLPSLHVALLSHLLAAASEAEKSHSLVFGEFLPLSHLVYSLAALLGPADDTKLLDQLGATLMPQSIKLTAENLCAPAARGALLNFCTLAALLAKEPASEDQSKEAFVSEELARRMPKGLGAALLAALSEIAGRLRAESKAAQREDAQQQQQQQQQQEGGPGLISRRRDETARTWEPLLADEHAPAHQLFVISTLRIACALPMEELAPSESVWVPLLCGMLFNAKAAFAHAWSKRLAKRVCGSPERYHAVRDEGALAWYLRKVSKLAGTSNGFTQALPYERAVRLVELLSTVAKIAARRPRNWERYCVLNPEVPHFLLDTSFRLAGSRQHDAQELLACFMKLLSGSLPAEAKKDDQPSELAARFVDDARLADFVRQFAVGGRTAQVRAEAATFVRRLWEHLPAGSGRERLSTMLWDTMDYAAPYGRDATEFVHAVASTYAGASSSGHAEGTEAKAVALLRKMNALVERHPNAGIYAALSRIAGEGSADGGGDLGGFYIESEPCLTCNSAEAASFSLMKVSAVKVEAKFTDSAMYFRLPSAFTVAGIVIKAEYRKPPMRCPKVVAVHYNSRRVSDIGELRGKWSQWKRLHSCRLERGQTEYHADLAIPVTATNLVLEFSDFFEPPPGTPAERLQCPRCGRPVTDRHGVCGHCRENAYQCPRCRNINYENLEGWLCNECGNCRVAKYELFILARPSFSAEPVETDDEARKATELVEREAANAHTRVLQLAALRSSLGVLASKLPL